MQFEVTYAKLQHPVTSEVLVDVAEKGKKNTNKQKHQ